MLKHGSGGIKVTVRATETEKEKSALYLWRGGMTSDYKKKKKTPPPAAHHHKPALNVGRAVADGNAHRGISLQAQHPDTLLHLCSTL